VLILAQLGQGDDHDRDLLGDGAAGVEHGALPIACGSDEDGIEALKQPLDCLYLSNSWLINLQDLAYLVLDLALHCVRNGRRNTASSMP
jgi:hypothetical protein